MRRPRDANHALLIGQTLGLAMRLEGFDVEIIDDEEGHHLSTFRVRHPTASYLVTVEPEAPDAHPD